MSKIIVAIDGPSGAGKSTVGKLLAKALGYVYIDTGAMYRAIGWKADRQGVEPVESGRLRELCKNTVVTLGQDGSGTKVYVDGEDVTSLIRTPKMSMMASAVSAQPSVRERLLELQREMGKGGGVVMDGRDIGTVVFPGAEAKFFLDADVNERARRRYEELKGRGEDVMLEDVVAEIIKRDEDDSSRDIAPLKMAGDALLVDTTDMSVEDVVELLRARVDKAVESQKA